MSGTEITGYQLQVNEESVTLDLEGDPGHFLSPNLPMARISFRQGAEATSFTNRGGGHELTRPIELLAPLMNMLRDDQPVFLVGDGRFVTSSA